MKRFNAKIFFAFFLSVLFAVPLTGMAGQEILVPYSLNNSNWSSGLAITNLSDETISQLAIDFYPSDGNFDVGRDRAVLDEIGPRAMVSGLATEFYPGDALPTDTYSLRIFHAGDKPFGIALFVSSFGGGFGFQQFFSKEFASMGETDAGVMAVHASPNAPAVDVKVDSLTAANNLTYPQNTAYLPVSPGDRLVELFVSGTDEAVYRNTLAVEPETRYSVFAVNEVDNLEVLVLEDDLSAPAEGNAHARFAHLSPDAPAADVTLPDGTPLFQDYEFKEVSMFVPVAAGSATLQVRAAGTDNVVLEIPNATFEEGKIYTIFARGLLGGTGDQALGAEIIENN